MANFIIRRLIQTVIILLIVSIIVFTIMHLLPGDPVRIMLGDDATKEEVNKLTKELGLDQPLWLQYYHWVLNVLHGDLGTSISYREKVGDLINRSLPISF